MLLRYFAHDGIHNIEVPDGTRVAFRSHIQVGENAFLDDLLLVPWQGRLAPIPGEIVPTLARSQMYGMRLAVTSLVDSPRNVSLPESHRQAG